MVELDGGMIARLAISMPTSTSGSYNHDESIVNGRDFYSEDLEFQKYVRDQIGAMPVFRSLFLMRRTITLHLTSGDRLVTSRTLDC